MSRPIWAQEIMSLVEKAIADKSISKESLADNFEEIAEEIEEWARQFRRELEGDE